MSPENRQERKRPSRGWAKHVREEKAKKRRGASLHITTPQERIDRFALPTWEQVQGMIEQRTYNDPTLYSLTFRYRSVLKRYFDARFANASGLGREQLDEFISEYYSDNEKNRNLTERLSAPLTIIRDSFPTSKPRR